MAHDEQDEPLCSKLSSECCLLTVGEKRKEGKNPSDVGEGVSEETSFQCIFEQDSTTMKPFQRAQRSLNVFYAFIHSGF